MSPRTVPIHNTPAGFTSEVLAESNGWSRPMPAFHGRRRDQYLRHIKMLLLKSHHDGSSPQSVLPVQNFLHAAPARAHLWSSVRPSFAFAFVKGIVHECVIGHKRWRRIKLLPRLPLILSNACSIASYGFVWHAGLCRRPPKE